MQRFKNETVYLTAQEYADLQTLAPGVRYIVDGVEQLSPASAAAVRGAARGAAAVTSSRFRGGGQLCVTTSAASAGRTWHFAKRAPFRFSSVSLLIQNHTAAAITVDGLGAAAAANLSDPKMLASTWVGDASALTVPAGGVAIRKLDVRSIAPNDGVAGYPVAGRIYTATSGPCYKTNADSAVMASLYPDMAQWAADAGTNYASSNQAAMPNAATNASINVLMSIIPHYCKPTVLVVGAGDSLDAFEFSNASTDTYARFDSPIFSAVRGRQLVGVQIDYISAAKASDGYTTFSTRMKAYIDLLLPDVVCIPNFSPNGLLGTPPSDADGVWAVFRAFQDLCEYAKAKGAAVIVRTGWPVDTWSAGDARIAALQEINSITQGSADPVIDVFGLAAGTDGRYASNSYKAQDGSNLHYSVTMRDAAAALYTQAFKVMGL